MVSIPGTLSIASVIRLASRPAATNGRLNSRRVAAERRRHLLGVHVEPPGDDHVLLAVDYVQIAAVIGLRDVTGAQPAVAQGARGLLRPVPVADHDVRPLGHDLARLTVLDG